MNSIEFRPAALADAGDLAVLLTQLGYPITEQETIRRLQDLLVAGEKVEVATRNKQVVGFVALHVMPTLHRATPLGRLTELVVLEAERGKGLGRALVIHAETILKSLGCEMIEITSNKSRTQAHQFYEQLGYRVTSLRFSKVLASSQV